MKYILSQKEYDKLTTQNTLAYDNTVRALETELTRVKADRNDLIIALWQALRDNPGNEPSDQYTVEIDPELVDKVVVQIGYRFSHTSPTRIYLFDKALMPSEETSS